LVNSRHTALKLGTLIAASRVTTATENNMYEKKYFDATPAN